MSGRALLAQGRWRRAEYVVWGASSIGGFDLRAEAWNANLEVIGNVPDYLPEGKAPNHIEEMVLTVRRARVLLDWSVIESQMGQHKIGIGVRGGLRADWNSLATGTNGFEFGGDVRWVSPTVRTRADGRMFMSSEYQEWGLRGMIELRSRDAYGLSASVNSSLGAANDGIDMLWNNGVKVSMPGSLPDASLRLTTEYKPKSMSLTAFGRYDAITKALSTGIKLESMAEWLLESCYTKQSGIGLAVRGSYRF